MKIGQRVSELWRVENRPLPLIWPMAYATACSTVQAMILLCEYANMCKCVCSLYWLHSISGTVQIWTSSSAVDIGTDMCTVCYGDVHYVHLGTNLRHLKCELVLSVNFTRFIICNHSLHFTLFRCQESNHCLNACIACAISFMQFLDQCLSVWQFYDKMSFPLWS